MEVFFKNQFKLCKSAAFPLPHRSGHYSNKMHSGWIKLPDNSQGTSLQSNRQGSGNLYFTCWHSELQLEKNTVEMLHCRGCTCINQQGAGVLLVEKNGLLKSHAQHRAHGCALQLHLPTPTCCQRQIGAALVLSKGWVQEESTGACPDSPTGLLLPQVGSPGWCHSGAPHFTKIPKPDCISSSLSNNFSQFECFHSN